MKFRLSYLGLFVLWNMLFQGCTQTLSEQFVEKIKRPEEARLFYEALDREIINSKVDNGALASISGFPYLKIDRYHQALAERPFSDLQKEEWLEKLQSLAVTSKLTEINNLSENAILRLSKKNGLAVKKTRTTLAEAVRKQSDILLNHDRKNPLFFKALVESAKVPDDYSTAMRGFGLYALAAPIFAFFTEGAYSTMKMRNQIPQNQIVRSGVLSSYVRKKENREQLINTQHLFINTEKDSFGLPMFSTSQELSLAKNFAPIFMVDVVAEYDRIGKMGWHDKKLQIDTEQPVVYYYFSSAFKQGKPIIQINYSIWFTQRAGPNSPWFEQGEMDGLTLRVSLDQVGVPFLVDIMNSCGCYHFFVPHKQRIKSVIPVSLEFDPLVIDWLPDNYPDQPLAIRLNSGWHQVDDISTKTQISTQNEYQLLPYQKLETLQRDQYQSESIFSPDGIVKGSDRIEPYFFFSMGVPDVGAMRQRGRHPIKLIGRLHFDDPYIIDKSFILKD